MYATSIPVINFFPGSVIFSQEHLMRFMCQGHYNKWSVIDSRNLKVCSFEESHCSPSLSKVPIYSTFHRISCSNFCLKRIMLNA